MTRATVICDASFCPHTHAGGWATWININYPNGARQRLREHGVLRGLPRSSEHAELLACMNGLWFAYQHGARDILVQTDCLALVQTLGGNSPKSRAEYHDACAVYWPEGTVRWKHVKGHTAGDDRRTWVNNWCDKHAKLHMRRKRTQCQTT